MNLMQTSKHEKQNRTDISLRHIHSTLSRYITVNNIQHTVTDRAMKKKKP